MKDTFGREINYLRWSVTDRCNLRCTYCMPQEKMVFSPREELLTIEEMQLLLASFYDLGIRKIRFTGGEPLMRKGIEQLFEQGSAYPDLKWFITTNGIFLEKHLEQLVQLGISGINISLDTLDSRQFVQLTKRDLLQPTLDAIDAVLEKGIPCKINTVVQEGINDDSIVEMTAWARDKNVEIRFIEFMPFNGKQSNNGFISGAFIENKIKSEFNVKSLPMKFGDTASKFQHESGSKVGVIHAFTRNFCGSCNRIRLDAKGNFRNCLYGASHQGLKEIIRSGAEDSQIQEFIRQQIASKPKNGFSAENEVPHSFESMSIVGG